MKTGFLALAAALLLGLAAHSALAAAPAGRNGRMLLQSGVSCPAQIPACTARRCTTRILDSKETYVCLRCLKGYVPARGSDGRSIVQCVCPAGTYQVVNGTTRSCQPCPYGSYCPGGDSKAKLPTDNIGGDNKACNPSGDGLTTKSEKSTRPADCIAKAGYVLPTSKGAPAQVCAGNTYAPAYNRLKTCLPCQSGLQAPADYNQTHADKNDVCQVPPGKFWELNVVRDCPKGLYRESYVRTDNKVAIACRSCPEGWTTANIATPTLNLCNLLMPGYKVANTTAGTEPNGTNPQSGNFVPPAAEACPVGFYYDGTAGILSCQACPYGSTTLKNGSTSVDECVVPPGYFIQSNGSSGAMVKCPTTQSGEEEGYYRPGWKAYKEVISSGNGTDKCIKCGTGILSRATEPDEWEAAPADSKVPATAASCYIKAGWGITFDPADFTKFKAIKPCPANTYGVANETFGLINAPCKACTKNLYSFAASTKFSDCQNPGGFGYTSEGANQCPDGFWAAKDSMAPCEPCPEGRTTYYQPGNGTYQDSLEDCIVPAGYGVFDGNASDPWNPPADSSLAAKPCPVGFYSNGETLGNTTANPTCTECANHTSTQTTGSQTCDVCAAGYGKVNGTCSACPYGYFNPGSSEACDTCPSTTYNDAVGDGYTSYGITFRTGLSGPESCVPRYAQLANPAGDRMALPDSMFNHTEDVTTSNDEKAAVEACITTCPANTCCIAEMARTDDGLSCHQARLTPIAHSTTDGKAKLYYKLPPSEISAASVADNTQVGAKTMASGIFAVCDIHSWQADAAAGLVGTSPNPLLVEEGRNATEWNAPECSNFEDCKAACISQAPCWGFIWHPTIITNGAFALRGGEMFLGGRTFFVSPDGKGAGSVAAWDVAALAWS